MKSINLNQYRNLSYKQIRSWYAGLVKPRIQKPPYRHVVQIGDPGLRTISTPVPIEAVTSPEIKLIISRLKSILKKYDCVGLSATQIGAPLRIFVIEFNKKHQKGCTTQEIKNMDISLFPQTVAINPEIKIADYTKVYHSEACESIKGFTADVPRYKAVSLKALNEHGEEFTIEAKGWIARIIQHEMDHLNGTLYTDIMNRKSLICSCWNDINRHGGKIELPYS